MQRLDALGVFFVGRVQRIQLFFVDDVEERFAHHGQLQTQAALAFALFGYFGNDPIQARWNLRADQSAVGVEQADGWIQRAVALVAFFRRRAEVTPPISVADDSSSEDSASMSTVALSPASSVSARRNSGNESSTPET